MTGMSVAGTGVVKCRGQREEDRRNCMFDVTKEAERGEKDQADKAWRRCWFKTTTVRL